MLRFRRLVVVLFVLCAITIVSAALVYRDIPTGNTDLSHFDTLIVLGTPANPDGSASPEQRGAHARRRPRVQGWCCFAPDHDWRRCS